RGVGDEEREQATRGVERQEAERREQPDDARAHSEPAPQPRTFELGKVAERPEPVEADHAQPEEQEAKSCECREETKDRDEDGRVLHMCLLWGLLVDYPPVVPRWRHRYLAKSARGAARRRKARGSRP